MIAKKGSHQVKWDTVVNGGESKQLDIKLARLTKNSIRSSLVTAWLGLQWYKLTYEHAYMLRTDRAIIHRPC